MGSDPRRNLFSVLVFWVFLLTGAAALGVGAVREHAQLDAAMRASLTELHISLGITAALLLVAQILLGLTLYLMVESGGPHNARRMIGFWLRQAVYLAFVAAAAAGALTAAFRGEQIFFWEYPLPFWDAGAPQAAEHLQFAHAIAAYAFGALAVLYAAFALFDRLSPVAGKALEAPAPASIATMIADGLAQSFRFFGATAFWMQLFLGVVSAMLLAFAFAGHSVSPGASNFGEAIYWASAALALMLLSILFGYRDMNAAVAIRSRPERYLAHERRMAFWFVGAGGFVNVMGALVSFIGVGLSVALLIGKTVSQPPGIAITDPNKIIRALDVFVLLVNFSLLFAHCIGVGVAAWLSISALKARHQYVVAREMARAQEAESAVVVRAPGGGEAAG